MDEENKSQYKIFTVRNTFPMGLLLILLLAGFVQTAQGQGANPAKQLPSPNWTHPKMRQYYNGYEKIKEKKSSVWRYKTNRQGGNVRGGGTTEYEDYKPFYQPYPIKGDKRKDRDRR